ncbi:Bacterial extracellular solute-binding protein [anaerobic digester metagenome]
MIKKISIFLASLMLLTACTTAPAVSKPESATQPGSATQSGSTTPPAATSQPAETSFDPQSWESVVAAARGTTVTHGGYGGDDALNEWIMGPFAQALKDKYDITLEYVQGLEFTNQLAVEKQTGITVGSYDTVWINGMNFRNLKDQGLLYGPYNQYLPNFSSTIDEKASDTNFDFTYPIEGFETPFSTAQLILIQDKARTEQTPVNAQQLLEFAKANPGKITYPTAEHFTGAAFIRTIIYDLVGYEQFMNMPADYDTVKKAVAPAMEYLRELNPYLWKKGTTFPAELIELDNMFINGEVELMMSYGPYDVGGKIKKGIYPQTAQAFIFDRGTVGNTSYYAIPFNAPNRAGALVAINEMLSPEMQLAKLKVGEEPAVTDLTKLTEKQRNEFNSVDLGPNNVPTQVLGDHRLPEYAGAIEKIITDIWLEEVVGKTKGSK